MSFDDDATDDSAGFRPPPHPDDRLWRHPSELHATPRDRASSGARHSRWGTAAVAGAGVTLIAAGAGVVTLGLRDQAQPGPVAQVAISPTDSEPYVPPDYAIANLEQASSDQRELARQLAPSVVRVDSGAARGSGVVIRDDGLVLTSAAVVGHQPDVVVALGDGRLLTGETIGTDPLTGVTLVDLPGRGYAETELTAVPSSEVGGAAALALGVDETGRLVLGPGALAATPSYVDRPDLARLDGVFAIATAVDPVAQGGPVVDDDGTLIGLATWIAEDTAYATPVAVLRKVVDDLLTTGTASHVWLGIEGYDASDYGWPAGVGVTGVNPDGPSAGVLRDGDVIVALDQQLVTHMSALVVELRQHQPGEVVQLSYRRTGHTSAQTRPVVLAQRPASLNA